MPASSESAPPNAAPLDATPPDAAASRAVIVGVIAPMSVALVAVIAQLLVLGDVPARVATHWGPEGVDGFAPAWTVPLMTLLMGAGLPILLAAIAIPAIRRGERGFVLRFLLAVAPGLGVFLTLTLTGSLFIQRGLSEAAAAPSVVPVMLTSLAVGIAAGLVGWWAQPHHPRASRASEPVAPLERVAGERAVWFGRAEMDPVPLGFLIGGAALLAVLGVILAIAGDPAAAWISVGMAAFLGILVGTLTVFRVRVDAAGLTVRSAAGLVRLRVPAREVVTVSTTHVSGLAQYGGFGIRSVPGATAVVLRSGPGLEVLRTNGRRFVVTVDDAGGAAAVLAAVAEDARAAQG